MKVMYSKTAKGVRESSGKTRDLSRDMRDVLKECYGLFSIEDKCAAAPPDEREWLAVALADLVAQGYLRDVPEVAREEAKPAPESDDLDSLDFSEAGQKKAREAEEKAAREAAAKAQQHAEEQARRDAAAKAKRDAEEKARHAAAEKTRREAEEKARRETEAKARREAEEKAKRDAAERERRNAEEKLRREAEERARREAEEKARREAEEQARLEEEARIAAAREADTGLDQVAGKLRAEFASRRGQRDESTSKLIREMEEEARRKAEEKAAREAEEKARRDAEERARREAEDKARREAEEQARREAEERARREAEEKARRDAEEKVRREAAEKLRLEAIELARRVAEEKARGEAEERARREAEERARREAEEKLRREAEEKARIEAAEKARIEAEERAKREAEEKLRREAEEKLRREAEEKARIEAEERARIEAEERARREEEEARRRKEEERLRRIAEQKAREEAEEKARLEQEERDREAIRERLRLRKEKQRRMILPAILGLLLPVAVVIGLLQVLTFDGKRSEFEKAATELFGVPVKAGSAKLGVLAGPQWIMNDVTIGADATTVKIARARFGMSWLGVFGAPLRFDSIRIEQPSLPPSVALALLHQESANALLKAGEVVVTGLQFAAVPKGLPPLNLRATFQDGRLTRVSGQGEDADSGKFSLDINREEQLRLSLGAAQMRWLLGSDLPLTDLKLEANLTPDALLIKEFSAGLVGGEVAGTGRLSWQGGWRATAKLEAKRLDTTKFAPAWFLEGNVNGNAVMSADAASSTELLSRAVVSGSFTIGRGLLASIDLDKVLQNRGIGEQFRFESLNGNFAREARRIELTDLALAAPELKAGGAVSIDANRAASGRIAIETGSGASRRTASVKVGGTLAAPQYQR
jgi:hypothetical protein